LQTPLKKKGKDYFRGTTRRRGGSQDRAGTGRVKDLSERSVETKGAIRGRGGKIPPLKERLGPEGY
jgi:hypothetical protein